MESSHEARTVKQLTLARWEDRFVAWLIDLIIVAAVIEALFSFFSLPYRLMLPDGPVDFPFSFSRFFSDAGARTLFFLAYWAYLEATRGQSLGKMVMNLKTVDLEGNRINMMKSILQSFGKAFLLPIDVVVGWIAFNEKRQRLFNRLSDTIVIKLTQPSSPPSPPGVTYVK